MVLFLTFWTCYKEHNITAQNNYTDPKTSRGHLSRLFPTIPNSWYSYSYNAPELVFVTNSIQYNWSYPLPRLGYKRLWLLCWASPVGNWMLCHKDTWAICGGVFYSEKLRYWTNSEELKPEPANNHVNKLSSEVMPSPQPTPSPLHPSTQQPSLGYLVSLMRDPEPELAS